jgi:tetratricopeptide (TPR) repeat protein
MRRTSGDARSPAVAGEALEWRNGVDSTLAEIRAAAREAERKHDWDMAARLWDVILSTSAKPAVWDRGSAIRAVARAGRIDEAFERLRVIEALPESKVAAAMLRAELEEVRGRDEVAAEFWEKAAALQSDPYWALYGLARSLNRLGRTAEAREAMARALVSPSAEPGGARLAARLDLQSGRVAEAETTLAAFGLGPDALNDLTRSDPTAPSALTPGARTTAPGTLALAEAIYRLLADEDTPRAVERLVEVVRKHGGPTGRTARCDLLDRVFSQVRHHLRDESWWLYGPLCQVERFEVLRGWFDSTTSLGGIVVDLGCGRESPFGLSVLIYLNGADATLATDFDPCFDEPRAALALYDLLIACFTSPESYKVSKIPLTEFRNRIERFDLERLREGDLTAGLRDVPCKYHVGSFKDAVENSGLGPIDLVVSFSVMEHVTDVPSLVADLYDSMADEGWMIHNVDFRDHRSYWLPLSPWAYLLEGIPAQQISNEIRLSEMIGLVEIGGFDILDVERADEEPPPEVWEHLRERFRRLPADDIRTQLAKLTFRRRAKSR